MKYAVLFESDVSYFAPIMAAQLSTVYTSTIVDGERPRLGSQRKLILTFPRGPGNPTSPSDEIRV